MSAVFLPIAAFAAPITPGVIRFFPAPDSVQVSPDTPLRIVFTAPVELGAAGKFHIHDAATGTTVETIDVQSPVGVKTIGGLDGYNFHSVLLDDREAILVPKPGTLAHGHRYYVTIEPGALRTAGAAFAGIATPDAWSFSTRSAAPSSLPPRIVVAADGSGDFCTVQGALDSIPEGNVTPVTVFVRKGVYREIIFFTHRHHVTLLGEDRHGTVITYANNAKFNGSGGNPFAGRAPDPAGENHRRGGNVYRRGMILAHRVQDFTLANLTLRNTTPYGGSQAEALIVNGTLDARTIIKDVDFFSFQDTLQINGQAYLTGCHIEGDVDFMWGTGPSFFEACTARTLRSGAYYTQVRNPATNHGFVFVDCTLEGAPGVTDNFLSRIEPHRFPHSEVVLVDCRLGPSVGAVGWQLQAAPKGTPPGATDTLRFWEAGSRTLAGEPINASQRLAVSRQLTLPADAAVIADYRNPTFVLGGDWRPRTAPIFKPTPQP